MADRVSALFVCMGNICRSPLAEGVFRKLIADAGLSERVRIDSAGTIDYHAGEPPDPRAIAIAGRHGIAIDDLRARPLATDDCRRYDLILAMDRGNLNRIRQTCGEGAGAQLFLEFAPARPEREVPDPYSSGREGFEYVFELIEAAAAGLLLEVRRRLDESAP